jgi:acetoin utilization deacetylase AcuC-like enzyme
VPAAPLTSSTKQAAVVRQALAEGLLDLREAHYDPALAWADICRVHDPAYVDAVRTGEPRDLAESQWFTWSPAFADSVARIWTGHVAASRLALTEGMVLHPVSGSHHAKRDHGAAFCTFAYIVGASLALLDEGRIKRVLLLDLDAHYGDGHDALTRDDARFVHFDIAAAGRRQIRRETRGLWIETPSPAHYLDSLCDELPTLLDRKRPDLVQALLGVDCYENDDVGGIGGMTAVRLRDRDRFVFAELAARRLPSVVSLAGGYSEPRVELHVQTVREAVAVRAAGRC